MTENGCWFLVLSCRFRQLTPYVPAAAKNGFSASTSLIETEPPAVRSNRGEAGGMEKPKTGFSIRTSVTFTSPSSLKSGGQAATPQASAGLVCVVLSIALAKPSQSGSSGGTGH